MPLPVGHNYTAYGTPMHVTQLMLALLKATFAEMGGENYAYRYTQDFNTTGVLIDVVLNKDSEIYGKKPQLVVARGAQGYRIIAQGDIGAQDIKTSNARRTGLVHSAVSITIVSKHSQEVELLGQEVFNFLVMARQTFSELLGIHHSSDPSLSEVAKMTQDDTVFHAVAGLTYSMQYKYRHLVPQNLLNSLDFYLNDTLRFQLPDA